VFGGSGLVVSRDINAESIFVPLSHRLRWLLIVGLVVLLIGIGVGNAIIGDSHLVFSFLSLTVLIGIIALPLVIYQPQWGLFHPLVFTVIWHGAFQEIIRKLPLLITGLDYHIALPGDGPEELSSLVVIGHFLTSLGFLGMYAGYWTAYRLRTLKWRFGPPRHLYTKIFFIALGSMLALLLLAREAGGIAQLSLQRGMNPELRASATLGGHWVFFAGLLAPACLVWLTLRPADLSKPAFLFLFSLSLLMGFLTTGSRSGLIMMLLFILVIKMLQVKRIAYLRAIVVSVFALLALGILGEFRSQSFVARDLGDIQLESGVIGGLERGWDTLTGYAGRVSGLYAVLALVPNQFDYLWGQSYLSIIAAPIPRTLWENKPIAGGRLAGIVLFGRGVAGGGVPPGNIGEAYWNFGVTGVFGVMFLYGVALRWLAAIYQANQGERWIIVIYVLTLFLFQPNSVSFYGWFHAIIPAIVSLVLFCGLPWRVRSISQR
jgi:oligosaccharide repeat unit polymerase